MYTEQGVRERGRRKGEKRWRWCSEPAGTQNATRRDKDNNISFPMAESDCHAPPCRHSFSGDFAKSLATPNKSAHRITLHHFRFYLVTCNGHRNENAREFFASGFQWKTRTNEYPSRCKRRPRQARLPFARRTEPTLRTAANERDAKSTPPLNSNVFWREGASVWFNSDNLSFLFS